MYLQLAVFADCGCRINKCLLFAFVGGGYVRKRRKWKSLGKSAAFASAADTVCQGRGMQPKDDASRRSMCFAFAADAVCGCRRVLLFNYSMVRLKRELPNAEGECVAFAVMVFAESRDIRFPEVYFAVSFQR